MPITITITDPTPELLLFLGGGAATGQAPMLSATTATTPVEEKPKANPRKKPAPEPEAPAAQTDDPELAAEIARDLAEAPSEPQGATAVVDAGTGKPMEKPAAEEKAMTMDEVRAAATRLAQADASRLKAILGEFGAGKLSEVKPDDLGDFAGKVIEALG